MILGVLWASGPLCTLAEGPSLRCVPQSRKPYVWESVVETVIQLIIITVTIPSRTEAWRSEVTCPRSHSVLEPSIPVPFHPPGAHVGVVGLEKTRVWCEGRAGAVGGARGGARSTLAQA